MKLEEIHNMDMVTELIVEEIKIQGGRKIRTAAYKTPNETLHDSMFIVGKLLRWLMKSKSNNMTRSIQPRDVRELWQMWEAHKKILDLAQKFSDSPSPVHEFNRVILLPHPSELQRFKNIKLQGVGNALHGYVHTCMTRDSADGTYIYEMIDYEEVLEAQRHCEQKMLLFVGTGQPLKDQPGHWDTGLPMPSLAELGTEIPSGDLDMLSFAEPSIDAPGSHLPDAPDLDPDTKSV